MHILPLKCTFKNIKMTHFVCFTAVFKNLTDIAKQKTIKTG